MAGVDQADAFLDARRLGVEHRPAHDEEDVLDALRLQAPGEDIVTRQFRHLGISSLVICCFVIPAKAGSPGPQTVERLAP